MACHWAYDTRQNRIVYGIICTLLSIGGLVMAAGIIGGYSYRSCLPKYRTCTNNNDAGYCLGQYEHCKIKTWINLIMAGAVICAVGFACTAYMCFCAMPPTVSSPQTVAMSSRPTSSPMQQTYVPTQAMGVPVMGYPSPMYNSPVQGGPYAQPYAQPYTQVPSHPPAFLVASVGGPTTLQPPAPVPPMSNGQSSQQAEQQQMAGGQKW